MRNQIVALENEAYSMVAVGIPITVFIFLCGNTVYDKVAAVIAVKTADNVQQGCFTRTTGAEYSNKFIVTKI